MVSSTGVGGSKPGIPLDWEGSRLANNPDSDIFRRRSFMSTCFAGNEVDGCDGVGVEVITSGVSAVAEGPLVVL